MKTVENSIDDYFYDSPAGDIYGNMPMLDEQPDLHCIEVRYHCNNCKSVMTKNVNTDVESKEPIICLFCQISVKPLELH